MRSASQNKELSENELIPHTVHNSSRKSLRYTFTTIILFFLFYLLFLSPHYSFNFHFYNLLLPCKKKTLFLKQISHIYMYFIIFVTFLYCIFENLTSTQDFQSLLYGICYQLCTFKNRIFSTHFYLGV